MFVLESIKKYAKTDRAALVGWWGELSYAELYARAQSFAAWLLKRFGDDRAPVVIYGHKERDFLPCVFGALYSGRGYVPVDTVIPHGRASEIAEEISPGVIVDFSGMGFEAGAEVLDGAALETLLSTPAISETAREMWVDGEQAAYILFTSGSTGKPKGVPITAANLTAFYHGLLPFLDGQEGGVILDQVSYSFDVSCCSVYAGLSLGMTLLTVGREMVEDIGALFGFLRESQLSVWVSTPSFAEICAGSKSFCGELMPSLRMFLFCGEILTHRLCERLAERFPKAQVLNTYGPTEATVLVSAVWVTEQMRLDSRPIPIGYPIKGTELRLDEGGELLILGDSVGPGYHKRPELTAERFFSDARSGKRGYRTGDICECENGCYYYRGRLDNQLKINGYRVETEDIENSLAKLEGIRQAAVIPVWEDGRVRYLAAFVLLEREDGLTPLKRAIAIKKQAAAYLPAYMIPRRIIALDAFPLNTNGKIDRKELAKTLLRAEKS